MRGESILDATILAVDDEPANVRLLERMLARIPEWRILSTTDSGATLDLVRDQRPDLILLDLHMPHPDGFTLLERLRQDVPEEEYLPILVLTADSSRQTRERALAAGASDFLTKPLDATEVLLRSRNLLRMRALHQRALGENQRLETEVRERTTALREALNAAEAASEAKSQFMASLRAPIALLKSSAATK